MTRRWLLAAAVMAATIAAAAAPAGAVTLPAGFTDTVVATVGAPTAIAFTPDGRMLVTTQPGRLRVITSGGALRRPTPALDLSRGHLRELRARPARRRGRPELRDEPLHLPLLHVQEHRHVPDRLGDEPRQPRQPLHAARDANTVDPASETRAGRQHPVAGRQPQRRRPAVRQGRQPLHQRRRRRLRLRRRSGCAGTNDAARDQHVLLGKILRITPTGGDPGRQPVRRAPSTRALQRHRPHDAAARAARRPSPGACATRSGSRSTRTPPARASTSTTSARTPGRRSTSAPPAPTTAGTCARATAPTARRPTAARRRPA